MDLDNAVPPPIRRSSREALELQKALHAMQLHDDNFDDAVPPPIARQRSTSLDSSPASTSGLQPAVTPPLPNKSHLRNGRETKQDSIRPSRNFSHPSREQFLSPRIVIRNSNPIPYRNPSEPISYRNNPRLPISLRRWSSLETIESVTTTQSVPDEPVSDELERPSFETSSTSFSTVDEEDSAPVQYSGLSETPLTHSSDTGSAQSASMPTSPSSPHKYSASSLLRKLKPAKAKEPLLLPEHLEIEKRVSLDQRSQRTHSSSSVMTISSGRPSGMGYLPSEAGSQPQISREWKSSDHDISNLSEADLKKCKKKGINPALYAEMKAARKGKFGVIGGNTIL